MNRGCSEKPLVFLSSRELHYVILFILNTFVPRCYCVPSFIRFYTRFLNQNKISDAENIEKTRVQDKSGGNGTLLEKIDRLFLKSKITNFPEVAIWIKKFFTGMLWYFSSYEMLAFILQSDRSESRKENFYFCFLQIQILKNNRSIYFYEIYNSALLWHLSGNSHVVILSTKIVKIRFKCR